MLPALICRFSEAKEAGDTAVNVWGTEAKREFLHVDDLMMLVFLLELGLKRNHQYRYCKISPYQN